MWLKWRKVCRCHRKKTIERKGKKKCSLLASSPFLSKKKMSPITQKGTLWELRKVSLRLISPFPHSLFKRILLQTGKNQGLFGLKGLKCLVCYNSGGPNMSPDIPKPPGPPGKGMPGAAAGVPKPPAKAFGSRLTDPSKPLVSVVSG